MVIICVAKSVVDTYERQSDIFVCISAFLVLSSGFEWFNLSTSWWVEVTSWFFCVCVLKAIVRMKVHHVTFLLKSRHFEEHVFIPSKGTMEYPKSLHKPCNSFVCVEQNSIWSQYSVQWSVRWPWEPVQYDSCWYCALIQKIWFKS